MKRAYDPAFEYEGGVHTMHVRISRNIATVSIDATGDPLYQRGWRTEAGPAPLRETLAAALLQWSGASTYKGVLTDPCCGAGTIMIEAAQMARRMPAGRHRSFAFENWMPVDPAQWAKLLAASDADIRGPLKKKYIARDIKGEMVDKARDNAERAGVLDDIVFEVGDATRFAHGRRRRGAGRGDQPAVRRTAQAAGQRSLYLALGKAERLAAIAPASSIASFKREFDDSLATSNGGLAVRFVRVAFSG